jgi:O-antigen ligase
MFVGQAQIIGNDQAATSVSSLGSGAIYQLSWMGIAVSILFFLFVTGNINGRALKFPLLSLLVYSVLGFAGSLGSLAPQLAAYKAGQVTIDAVLSIVALSYIIKYRAPRLLVNFSYFLLMILVSSASLGGILVPELAFKELGFTSGDGGSFGAFLRGVYPIMAANELGLLSGIVVVLSVRRFFEQDKINIRFFWFSAALLGASVALLAQSRTSLASALFAIMVMAFTIKKLRKFVVMFALLVCVSLVPSIISNNNVGLVGDVTEYARRGSTDEQLENLSGRTILFKSGLRMSADRPFFGYGFETGARLAGVPYGIAKGSNMHNAHMQVIVDSGYVGYIVWLCFLLSSVWIVWRYYWVIKRQTNTELKRYVLECSLVIFVIFFRSFFGHVLVSHQQNIMIFLAIVISIICMKYTQSQSIDASSSEKKLAPNSRVLSNNKRTLFTRLE